ncbi:MAG: hypothetical protein E6R08_03710 [Nevskiaceae bacterium]|uniref:hypothetical protein n=1 Tax=Pseudomonas shirazica TaxID=1940636 RepID=UPI0011DA55E6|nr:hypothetical protein [Pseudomonas shirazica]TXG98866.1 MAG: hypothetical protein E6R08_03710 [Nevskiaceae bacterium]
MYKLIILNWLKSSLMGVGCSLLAAAFVAAITPEITTKVVVFCLIAGFVLMAIDLVLSLTAAKSKK